MKNKLYVCDMKDITIRVANNVEAEEVYKALHKEGIETDRLYRRTGRTTRIVDDAIQSLFEVGSILLPHHNTYTDKEGCYYDDVFKVLVVRDHHRHGQEDLGRRIVDRLKREHSNEYYTKTGHLGWTIRLKQ